MLEHPIVALASVVAIGIAAQWLSWRIHLPAIFFLLVAGFIAGPVSGALRPDELLGDSLFPMVSLAVAIILFEGGLSLNIAELRTIGKVVRNLITVGVLTTWISSALLAHWLLGFSRSLSALLGAILVVTGPTVIVPMLRQIRPSARVASAVKWEGIVNDPIGAILAVLVFDAIVVGGGSQGNVSAAALGIVRATAIGGVSGLLGAAFIIVLLKRYWVPDYLQSPVTLAVVLTVFTVADVAMAESGLLSVTVMGSALASQRWVTIRHIIEFKENLRVLLISMLFVILAARLPLDDPAYRDPATLAFFASLVFVVRPLTVTVATWRTALNWRERVFLGFMAPRGIVAAAVASVFSIELLAISYPDAELLAPVMFMVIVGTVALYGLTAGVAARRLGVASPNPQGVLFLGASHWTRDLAQVLSAQKIKVALLDSNWKNVAAARQAGLKTYYGNALSSRVFEDLELGGIGYLLAVTPNDEVNALASLHFSELFPRSHMFQLPGEAAAGFRDVPQHLQARLLFDQQASYWSMLDRFSRGAVFKQTRLTEEFGYDQFCQHYGASALPLFAVSSTGALTVLEAKGSRKPKAGQTLISLTFPRDDSDAAGAAAGSPGLPTSDKDG